MHFFKLLKSILKSRIALARFEIEAEKRRMTALILCTLAGFFAIFLGVILAVIAMIFYFWESKTMIAFMASAVFILLGLSFFAFLPRFLKSTLFVDSLCELKKDMQLLKDMAQK